MIALWNDNKQDKWLTRLAKEARFGKKVDAKVANDPPKVLFGLKKPMEHTTDFTDLLKLAPAGVPITPDSVWSAYAIQGCPFAPWKPTCPRCGRAAILMSATNDWAFPFACTQKLCR
jgi:ribosomal protein S27AE